MCLAPSIKIPDMPEPEPVPSPVSEDVINEMLQRRARSRSRAGHAGTIMTSGLEEEETGHKKTLLGG